MIPVLPQFWDLLSQEDQDDYLTLRGSFDTNTWKSGFIDQINAIKVYAQKDDEKDWVRFLVCGICWLGNDIAVNLRQLCTLFLKSKSSINLSFHKHGYVYNPLNTEVLALLFEKIPILQNDMGERRQWTFRKFDEQLIQPVMERHNLPIPDIIVNEQIVPQFERHNLPVPEVIADNPQNVDNLLNVGILHFSQERIENEEQYRIDASESIIHQPIRGISKRGHYHIKENLKAVEIMKKTNIWPILHFPEAVHYAKALAEHFQISERTIRDWIHQLQINPNWEGPIRHLDRNKSFVFNFEQETELKENVLDLSHNFQAKINNRKFRVMVNQFIQSNNIKPKWKFNCSPKWIASFKERNGLSTRKAHLKKRPKTTDKDIEEFRNRVDELLQTVNPRYVINADESPWHLNEILLSTWAEKGSEDVIIDGVPKECFTFLASVNANDELLPPVFLASGKSTVCERKWFGEAHPIESWNRTKADQWKYLTDHTKKGWTNRKFWAHYLDFLRKYIDSF